MAQQDLTLIIDIDGTLCPSKKESDPIGEYENLEPFAPMVRKIREYKAAGYTIVLHTARHMRTTGGNVGIILAKYSQHTFRWLEKHDIPYDEILFGKPWPGRRGFYVDDRAVRPSEFLKYSAEELERLIQHDSHVDTLRG